MKTFIDFLIENYEEPNIHSDYLEIPRRGIDEYGNPIHSEKHEYLSQILNPSSDMKRKVKNVFRDYTEQSKKLNAHLWNLKLGDVGRVRGDKDMRRSSIIMNDTLDKFPVHDKDFVVYSGVGDKSNVGNWVNNGGIIHIPSFTSSSLNVLEARNFAGIDKQGYSHILRIRVPAHARVGGYIASLSKFPQEEEYLFKPNQLLQVHHPIVYENPENKFGRKFKIYDAHFMSYDDYKDRLHTNKHPEIESYRYFNQKINRGF